MSPATGRITGKQLRRLYQLAGGDYETLATWSKNRVGCLPGYLSIDQANDLIWKLENTETTNDSSD